VGINLTMKTADEIFMSIMQRREESKKAFQLEGIVPDSTRLQVLCLIWAWS
jgi:hypothetical protein